MPRDKVGRGLNTLPDAPRWFGVSFDTDAPTLAASSLVGPYQKIPRGDRYTLVKIRMKFLACGALHELAQSLVKSPKKRIFDEKTKKCDPTINLKA